jgi:hypothetical protein
LGIHSFRNLVVIGGILWIAFVVEATQFIEYSRNVLLTNGQWVSSKLLMQMYVMGSEQFMTTRNALFRDRLHLGGIQTRKNSALKRTEVAVAMTLPMFDEPLAVRDNIVIDENEEVAGVESFNTVQEVAYDRSFNRFIRLDHVILTFHLNDFETTPVAFREAD